MSTQTKHTPTPWTFSDRNWRNEPEPHDFYICGDRHEAFDDEDKSEGMVETAVAIVKGNPTAGDIPLANAAFICLAVNAHDELVKACWNALGVVRSAVECGLHGFSEEETANIVDNHVTVLALEAALAKAGFKTRAALKSST